MGYLKFLAINIKKMQTLTFTQNQDGSFPSQFVQNTQNSSIDEYVVTLKSSVTAASIQAEIDAQNTIITTNTAAIAQAKSDESEQETTANGHITDAQNQIVALQAQLTAFQAQFPSQDSQKV